MFRLNIEKLNFLNKIVFSVIKKYWEKTTYDENGNLTYYEDSNGYWQKTTYDEKGNETYYENSKGKIFKY